MSEIDALYTVRPYDVSDKAFIMSTFLRGLYYGDSWFSQIDKSSFMNNYKHVVESLIDTGNTVVLVACLKDEPSVILGYSILGNELNRVHFVYVKKPWRNQGIATRLLPQSPKVITHLTNLARTLLSKYPEAIFNPFALK